MYNNNLRVKISKVIEVDRDAARQIAEDFAEWLEQVGFEVVSKNKAITDERGYDELAREWLEEVTGSRED